MTTGTQCTICNHTWQEREGARIRMNFVNYLISTMIEKLTFYVAEWNINEQHDVSYTIRNTDLLKHPHPQSSP